MILCQVPDKTGKKRVLVQASPETTIPGWYCSLGLEILSNRRSTWFLRIFKLHVSVLLPLLFLDVTKVLVFVVWLRTYTSLPEKRE